MTHWKELTNHKYLGGYSIKDRQDIVLTIKHIQTESVVGNNGKKSNCAVCYFVENVKPMILNAINSRTITNLYKTPYKEQWEGKKIQIGVEWEKSYGNWDYVLRVRPVIPETETVIKCSDCGKDIQPLNNMTASQLATYTKNKYGRALCSACATKAAQEKKDNEVKNDADE